MTVRLINENDRTLDLVASYGLSDSFLNKGVVVAEKSIGSALKGKTIIIEDVSKEEDQLQYPRETKAEGINSIVCLPIRLKDETIGEMRLYSECTRKYPKDFITVMEALVHTGALAIQNASMYLALQEDKKSLEEDIWSHRLYF